MVSHFYDHLGIAIAGEGQGYPEDVIGKPIVFLAWPNVYVLTAAILPVAVVIPVTNSVVEGYRIAMTPDRLLGRVESVRSTISQLITPLGPLTEKKPRP